MSDIKMSDVFVLPVEARWHGHGYRLVSLCDAKAESAVHAINSHDTLTARVAELESRLYTSIDRLNDCIKQDDGQAYKEAEKFINIALKALEDKS
tara:strand:+ start:133 stop:417 length:285 start_codon:yes stop_codon:yes gene_type:complete